MISIRKLLNRLGKAYPEARCALRYSTPLELLVATILSAQCTDVRVNQVTPALFKKYRSAHDFGCADPKVLEDEVRSTGFYKNKAKAIRLASREIDQKFDGKVPNRLEDLVTLQGVGRKTANVVLGNAFGIPGITVDTHVRRLSNRLGLVRESDPVKIEFELMKLIPRNQWTRFSHQIIFHGRQICSARRPKCQACPVEKLCPKIGV